METQFEKAKMITDAEGTWLAIKMPRWNIMSFLETMKPKKYTCTIKEFYKKRSLNANAYMWQLLGKIASVVLASPDEIYRDLIKDIGDNYEVFAVRDEFADRFPDVWAADHIGWIAEKIGPSNQEGYTDFRCFYGSSVYDSKQMSRLTDLVSREAKELGIETLSEMELSRLKEEWQK